MTTGRNFEITGAKGGVAFGVRVVTRSANTELGGMQDDGILKVRLKASPAGDPAANKELVDFLAEQLNVPVEKIEIVGGSDKSEKLVSVEGVTPDYVESRLASSES